MAVILKYIPKFALHPQFFNTLHHHLFTMVSVESQFWNVFRITHNIASVHIVQNHIEGGRRRDGIIFGLHMIVAAH